MEKYILVILLFVNSSSSEMGDKINKNAEEANESIDSQKPVRNVRSDEDNVPESISSNYMIGAKPLNHFGVTFSDKIREMIQKNKNDERNEYNYEQMRNEYNFDRMRNEYNFNRMRNEYNFEERERNYAYDYNAGNPDLHAKISRPCEVYDKLCIRKFFAEHSTCKISGREVPDPMYRAEGNFNFASANISETQIDARYSGMGNAQIVDFYINRATDNLLIAITFDQVTRSSLHSYFKFYVRRREPVVTSDYVTVQFGVMTITVIIPNINNLNLAKSEMYTFADNDAYTYNLGPRLLSTTDPEAAQMYTYLLTNNVPLEYRETISSLGGFVAGNYIQYNICDFGIKFL